MALTAKMIADLNGSNEAHRLAAVGTLLASLEASVAVTDAVVRGSYTAVADDATAGEVVIVSGLAAIAGWTVQVLRAGVDVTGDAVLTATTGSLSIADGSTYAVTADDVVNYVIW